MKSQPRGSDVIAPHLHQTSNQELESISNRMFWNILGLMKVLIKEYSKNVSKKIPLEIFKKIANIQRISEWTMYRTCWRWSVGLKPDPLRRPVIWTLSERYFGIRLRCFYEDALTQRSTGLRSNDRSEDRSKIAEKLRKESGYSGAL